MRRIIFYSWQSDLPNPCNRSFIERALEEAALVITADEDVAVEPVVDRDTQNVPGSPDIASTIFAKISVSDIFIADVSIISKSPGKRPTPNPNVLIELGYALKVIGHERIILIFNKAFGEFEDLPFDLRTRRLLAYNMPEEVPERAPERKKLAKQIEEAIRIALKTIPIETPPVISIPAVEAIENSRANRIIILRQDLNEILKQLESNQPKKHSGGGTIEDIINALTQTQEIVAKFSKIAETIVIMKDFDSILDMYRWFGRVFEHYSLSKDFVSGPVSDGDYDFFRFVGHEMFVTLIAFMIREQQWDMLTQILNEMIPIKYLRNQHGPGNVTWEFAFRGLPLFGDESARTKRISVRADILKVRHTKGGLGTILPFEDFMAAELFLFLRGELPPPTSGPHFVWNPSSCIYLEHIPLFIMSTENRTIAGKVSQALGLSGPDEFKKRFQERIPNLERKYSDISFSFKPENFNFIATKGLAQIISAT